MKKQFTKKLVLQKETVSTLTDNQMDMLRGGTAFLICTESCSAFMICCNTKTIPIKENKAEDALG